MANGCFGQDCMQESACQCAGLPNKPCFHFCCTKHARGVLCDECAAEMEQRKLFKDYISTSVAVGRIRWFYLFLVPIAFMPQIFKEIFSSRFAYTIVSLVFILLIFGIEWLIYRARLRKACAEHKRFLEFYRAFSAIRKRDPDALMKITREIAVENIVWVDCDMQTNGESAQKDARRILRHLENINPVIGK